MLDSYSREKEISDRTAAAYDSVYGSLIAYARRWSRLCEKIGRYCRKDAMILEIGCGTATFLEAMEKRGFRNLHGCDLSPECLKIAQEKVGGAKFETANMIALPYADGMFDLVVFMGSLHHLPHKDISRAIAESSRVLRGGGGAGFW
jgi:ubiquinone/menaquinone biosynthesis C-methylase UbiE